MNYSMPGFPVHHKLPELAQTPVQWTGDAIQPSHPLSLPSPPAFNLPSIRVFSNESVLCNRWPKYWSFSFSISLSNEYSGLISFRMMLWKCYTQYASTFGKLSSGHRIGKGQFSFQSQRKAMPKNAQTTSHLHSSHMLAKLCSKCSKPGFNSTWTVNFQMFKLDLERQRNQRSNCQHPLDHQKSKRVPEKHLLLLYWLCQSLWLCGSQ